MSQDAAAAYESLLQFLQRAPIGLVQVSALGEIEIPFEEASLPGYFFRAPDAPPGEPRPLVVLNKEALYPWPLGIMAYQGEYSTDWQLVLAFITLTILPAVLLFMLAQRWVVAGLTAGAVKG